MTPEGRGVVPPNDQRLTRETLVADQPVECVILCARSYSRAAFRSRTGTTKASQRRPQPGYVEGPLPS